jgi:error-prone DNA polymerase
VRVSTLRTLARADAFSSLGLSRQQALWELRSYSDAPLPLFDSLPKQSKESGSSFLPLPSPCGEVLRDYETTAHSLRGPPLLFLRSELEEAGAIPTSHLRSTKHGATVICAGIVLVRQRPSTAAGTVFLTIEDETGIGNLIIKPEVYAQFRDPIAESSFLLVQGTLQRAGAVIHLLVERAKSLDHTISSLTNLPGVLPSLSRDFH